MLTRSADRPRQPLSPTLALPLFVFLLLGTPLANGGQGSGTATKADSSQSQTTQTVPATKVAPAKQTANTQASPEAGTDAAATQSAGQTAKTKANAVKKETPIPVPPAITIVPPSGAPGSPVTITGEGFGAAGKIRFNGMDVPLNSVQWGDKTISVPIPSDLTPGDVTLTVAPNSGKAQSATFTVTLPPAMWFGKVSGDFSPFLADDKTLLKHLVGTILTQDYKTIGQFCIAPH